MSMNAATQMMLHRVEPGLPFLLDSPAFFFSFCLCVGTQWAARMNMLFDCAVDGPDSHTMHCAKKIEQLLTATKN